MYVPVMLVTITICVAANSVLQTRYAETTNASPMAIHAALTGAIRHSFVAIILVLIRAIPVAIRFVRLTKNAISTNASPAVNNAAASGAK